MSSIVFNDLWQNVTPRYPDLYFDIAICDIPYGLDVGNMAYLKEVGCRTKQRNGSILNGNGKKKPFESKDWDKIVPGQDYFDELRRISKNQIIFGVEYVDWIGLGGVGSNGTKACQRS